MRRFFIFCLFIFSIIISSFQAHWPAQLVGHQQGLPPYKNPSRSIEERVTDLISRMTLEEKILQMQHDAPAVPRLDIPKYNWWNECLHGVARAGVATVFPQAIGLAAMWDTNLMHRVASVISTEARAKHHEFVRQGKREIYEGLTFWSPNINIFRDPRWGRGQETYGEDPYLTGRMGVAFVKGLQGDDPRYFKVISTPKHYAVHSGPEPDRHSFDARINERDLREIYLPAFEACVKEGKAYSVMCAYNRFDGKACCGSDTLLLKILRDEWGFEGYVVSDCGAISDIFQGHRILKAVEEAAALGVKSGCDLSCGQEYGALPQAVKQGLISEKEIDVSLRRLFGARFKLGMFDPPDLVPYTKIPYSENDSPEHDQLALEAARESIVLLKNDNHTLPLNKNLKKIAVIGPNADEVEVLLGNYNGTPSHPVTPLQGIRKKVGATTEVLYAIGCGIAEGIPSVSSVPASPMQNPMEEAIAKAKEADAVILFMGLSPRVEGEEMDVKIEGFFGGDRTDLKLPATQDALLKNIAALNKPTVLVLLSGSAVAVNWANEHIPAIVEAWYPGQQAGTAIADVLFGDYNPGGRLPVTFYKSVDQVQDFKDYNMAGRTYRYFSGEPLYPFGHGLSYTKFSYGNLTLDKIKIGPKDSLYICVDVKNIGDCPGDEVVELYVTDEQASVPIPIRSLQGFKRIHLKPGEMKHVEFTLTPRQFSLIDKDLKRAVEPGFFTIAVGGKQPGFKGMADSPTTEVLTARFEVVGKTNN